MARVDMKWGGVYGSGSKRGTRGDAGRNTEKRAVAARTAWRKTAVLQILRYTFVFEAIRRGPGTKEAARSDVVSNGNNRNCYNAENP